MSAMHSRRQFFKSAAGSAALFAFSPAVHGHELDEGGGLWVEPLAARPIPGRPNDLRLSLRVGNGTGGAVTLRRWRTEIAERAALVRMKSVFGVEVPQAVSYLRLDPGETIDLVPPAYEFTLYEAAVPEGGVFLLTVDAGALGAIETVITLSP